MKRSFSLLLVAGCAALCAGCPGPRSRPAGPSAPDVPFVEVAAASGIDFRQHTGMKASLDVVSTSAGGCGLIDYDGDGFLDIYLVQGQHGSGPGSGNRLYRNLGDGAFVDVTEKAGVRGHGYGIGCAVGDFDGDGKPDLYVCNYGTNELFHNRGDGTFSEEAHGLGADVQGLSVGAVFADLDGDGWPDLYVARYVHLTRDSQLQCNQNGVPTPCGPQFYPIEPGVFLHNDHGQRFVDRTRASGLVDDGRAMSLTCADLNGDGRLDLFVANDTTPCDLFLGKGGGRFANGAVAANVAFGDMGVAEGSMGCDVGDYDEDGRPDLFVAVTQDRMSLLFHNDGDGAFTLASRTAGLSEAGAPPVKYGAGFVDYNNDGRLDLFQSNGHFRDKVQQLDPQQRYAQPRQLFENTGGGQFVDRSAAGGPALTTPYVGRGAAFGDLDNDGDVDILVNTLDGPALLLRNQAERLHRHWLRVRLVGKRPNVFPEGTVAELKVGGRILSRHLHSTYSYAAANDPRLHFGLGQETQVGPLTVRWLNGKTQTVSVPGVDRELIVRQP